LPAAIVTEDGTVAELELLANVTFKPPVGAGSFKVAVPVEEVPPDTLAGLRVTEAKPGGVIVKVAVTEAPVILAVIVAVFCAETTTVLTVKVAEVLPAATVTLAGTVAVVELLDSFTTIPPVKAAPVSVTVPVDEAPPAKVLGLKLTLDRVAAVIVRVAVWDAVPTFAVIVAVC
jgi:hypothetical protein